MKTSAVRIASILLIGSCPIGVIAPVNADVVTFQSGGKLRGRIVDSEPARKAGDTTLATTSIRTMTGARVVIDNPQIREAAKRAFVIEEFEQQRQITPPAPEALWRLAEWCRVRGLNPQRSELLREILDVDPGHLRARAALGQNRQRAPRKSQDEEMRSRGFVKYNGRYVAPQEIPLLKAIEAQRKTEVEWSQKVRSWIHSSRDPDPMRSQQARVQLLKINTPDALTALVRYLRKQDADEDSRMLFVRIVANISGSRATSLLVDQSLFDASKEVRITAQTAITEDRYPDARTIYINGLRNHDNDVVRTAGFMLSRLGDGDAVPNLAEALVTTHDVSVQVYDDSNSYSARADGGGFAPSAGNVALPPQVMGKLLAGQYPDGVIVLPPITGGRRVRTITVPQSFENPEVLAALETITGKSFGYDEAEWMRWYSVHKTGVSTATVKP